MRELWASIVQTSAARIYGLVVGIAVLFLTARWLGPEGRGIVAAITTWVALFGTFVNLSLGQVALRRLSGSDGRCLLGPLVGTLLAFAATASILGWAVAWILIAARSRGVFSGLPAIALTLGFLSLPLLVWEEYSSALLLAIKRLRTYNFLQLIGRTAGLVGVSVLVLGVGAGVIGVLLATLLGQVIIAAGAFAYLASEVWGRGQKIAAQRVELLGLLAGGIRLHFNAVGTVLFSSTGVLILNHYRGPAETAYYQLAVQLVGALMVFPQAASLAIYEKVVALGADGAWRLHRRVLLRILIGIVVLCAIVGMSAPVWLVALAGEPFRPAVEIFQWMLLGVIGMAFSAIMAPQWIVRGYFVQASALTLTVGIASFTTSLFLIPRWGLHGAVFAFLGTYFISVLANAVMAFHCESCARRDAS